MDKKRILLADIRAGESDAVGEYRDYRDWAIEVGVDLDIVKGDERKLEELVAQIGDNIDGLLLLRDSESSVSGEELEKQLAAVSIPVAEVFLYDLGGHRFVDRTEPGHKVLRTIYGRLQRGVRWGLHFLKYCQAHPYTTLPYGMHPSHIGDLFLPEGAGPFPVVMLIHGGFWRDGYYRDSMHGLAADLAKRGYAAWNVEYRRVGPSGGGYPESLQDVLEALNYLRELRNSHWLDLSRIAVVGHSAGGYLSIWAASIPAGDLKKIMPVPQVKVKLGVSLAGVTDLDEAHKSGGGDQAATHFLKSAANDEALRKQLSAGYLQYESGTKLMLVHGSNDDYVPVELSKYTLELLLDRGAENVELFLFPNSGHNEFVDPESVEWQKVAQRMEILL